MCLVPKGNPWKEADPLAMEDMGVDPAVAVEKEKEGFPLEGIPEKKGPE